MLTRFFFIYVLQDGFSGESFRRGSHLCVTTGLHYSRCIRGCQITKYVSIAIHNCVTELLTVVTDVSYCKTSCTRFLDIHMCSKTWFCAFLININKLRTYVFFLTTETLIMWFCVSWLLMMKMWKMWPCRSTLPSFRLSAVRMTSTSSESTTPGAWQKYWVEEEVENRVGVNLWTCTVSWSQ